MISFIRFRLITGCGWIDHKKKRFPVLQDKPNSTETANVAGSDRQDNFFPYCYLSVTARQYVMTSRL